MWDAILDGEEVSVNPTSDWVRRALSDAKSHQDKFICLLRDANDQMNALYVDGAFVMEWYRAEEGGHLAGFRIGDAPAEMPKKPGFLTRFFQPPPPVLGSRLSLEDAARMLDQYVAGAQEFTGFEWKKIRDRR